LCQLNLCFGLCCFGTVGKDVEDQVTAVDGFDVNGLFDVANLCSAEFIVKDQEADVFAFSVLFYFFELALSNIGFGVWVLQFLNKGFYGCRPSGGSMKLQFFKVFPDLKIFLFF